MIGLFAIIYLLIGVVISVLEFENVRHVALSVIPEQFKHAENAILLVALLLLVVVGPVLYVINLFRSHE